MFTGLIASTGSVLARTQTGGGTRITVAASLLAAQLRTGDSIAVNGVCLTALQIEPAARPPRFSADLAGETLARTTLGDLREGSMVNLELPTPAGAPLGGHVVQGHVDGVGTLLALDALHRGNPETDWRMRIELPEGLARYAVTQGSITVEGISLTIASLTGNVVEIAVIPHTYAATNLHTLAPEARVNIETDVLARYAERRSAATFAVTAEYLMANGY